MQDTKWIILLDAPTGTGGELECSGAQQVSVEYEFAIGATAGVVVLEHSTMGGYSGIWAVLDSQDAASLGGGSKAFSSYEGPLGVIRPRVTTAVIGGAGPKCTVCAKRLFGR